MTDAMVRVADVVLLAFVAALLIRMVVVDLGYADNDRWLGSDDSDSEDKG